MTVQRRSPAQPHTQLWVLVSAGTLTVLLLLVLLINPLQKNVGILLPGDSEEEVVAVLPTERPTNTSLPNTATVPPTATSMPTRTPTLTVTPLPSATATATNTAAPTLAANLRMPPAIVMLHSHSNMDVNAEAKQLDNIKFLEEFLPLLKNSDFTVTTFEQLEADPGIKNPLIIIVDQWYWGKILNDHDRRTFEMIDEAGFPAVIGIVPVPVRRFDNNALAGEYMKKGWELANNADTYRDLTGMHWFDIAAQVGTGGGRMSSSIVVGVSKFPMTLIPPYGKIDDNLFTAIKEIWIWPTTDDNIKWVVANTRLVNGVEVPIEVEPYDIHEGESTHSAVYDPLNTVTVTYVEASANAQETFENLVQRYGK